jgi:hypothetical protein
MLNSGAVPFWTLLHGPLLFAKSRPSLALAIRPPSPCIQMPASANGIRCSTLKRVGAYPRAREIIWCRGWCVGIEPATRKMRIVTAGGGFATARVRGGRKIPPPGAAERSLGTSPTCSRLQATTFRFRDPGQRGSVREER